MHNGILFEVDTDGDSGVTGGTGGDGDTGGAGGVAQMMPSQASRLPGGAIRRKVRQPAFGTGGASVLGVAASAVQQPVLKAHEEGGYESSGDERDKDGASHEQIYACDEEKRLLSQPIVISQKDIEEKETPKWWEHGLGKFFVLLNAVACGGCVTAVYLALLTAGFMPFGVSFFTAAVLPFILFYCTYHTNRRMSWEYLPKIFASIRNGLVLKNLSTERKVVFWLGMTASLVAGITIGALNGWAIFGALTSGILGFACAPYLAIGIAALLGLGSCMVMLFVFGKRISELLEPDFKTRLEYDENGNLVDKIGTEIRESFWKKAGRAIVQFFKGPKEYGPVRRWLFRIITPLVVLLTLAGLITMVLGAGVDLTSTLQAMFQASPDLAGILGSVAGTVLTLVAMVPFAIITTAKSLRRIFSLGVKMAEEMQIVKAGEKETSQLQLFWTFLHQNGLVASTFVGVVTLGAMLLYGLFVLGKQVYLWRQAQSQVQNQGWMNGSHESEPPCHIPSTTPLMMGEASVDTTSFDYHMQSGQVWAAFKTRILSFINTFMFIFNEITRSINAVNNGFLSVHGVQNNFGAVSSTVQVGVLASGAALSYTSTFPEGMDKAIPVKKVDRGDLFGIVPTSAATIRASNEAAAPPSPVLRGALSSS